MAGMRPMAQSLNLQQQHLQHLQLLQQQQQGQQQRPPALDAALERIQNSLTTLHARMNELEQPQPGLVKTAFLHFLVLLNLRQARTSSLPSPPFLPPCPSPSLPPPSLLPPSLTQIQALTPPQKDPSDASKRALSSCAC